MKNGAIVLIRYCGLAIGAIGLQGCASKPTVGERMLTQGEGTADLGKQWESGSERVRKGEKLVTKGEKLVESGRKDIEDGEPVSAKAAA